MANYDSMRMPVDNWTKTPIALLGLVSLVLLAYWSYWWSLGLASYTTEGSTNLAGFLGWLLGYVLLLSLLLGVAWLNHRLLFRRLVARRPAPYWGYLTWLLVLWWLLFELFQLLNDYATEVIIENWFVSLLCMLLIAALTLAIDQPEVRRQKAELEQGKTAAELHNLRAQLQPHFLFNTLNTIYSEALQRDQDELATLIGELSGLLRFSFKHGRQETVSLQEEIDFLNSYLHLQLARLTATQRAAVTINLIANPPMCELPPLLLIPFLENAFVHGVHSDPGFFLHIDLRVQANDLVLTIANQKRSRPSTSGNGIGLSNTRQRLDRLYPNQYVLTEEQAPTTYKMYLQFPLSLTV